MMKYIYSTFFCVTFYMLISDLSGKPCFFVSELSSERRLNKSVVASDGAILFMLDGIQNNCMIDLDDVFELIHDKTQEKNVDHDNDTKVLKECGFVCAERISVHFFTNDTTSVRNTNLSIALLFGRCSIYLEELSLFAKYGDVWSIIQSSDSLIHVPPQKINCTFTQHLRIIHSKINCDSETTFFWQYCEDVFERVNILQLEACATSHWSIKSETLVERFPQVQALQLNYIDLTTQMSFPWTNLYADSTDVRTFIFNDADQNKSVTSMGRDIRIYNSDILDMVYLRGMISNIVINKANFNQNESELFRNVTGLYKVEISDNHLPEINAELFKNQSDIKHIILQGNGLKTLPPYIFEDQQHLLFLDLSKNKLSSLDRNLLKNQKFLQELHLEHNRLEALPQYFLKEQIGSLKFLYLHSNPMKTIPVMPFYGRRIETIDMHESSITGESLIELANNINIFDFLSAESDRREARSRQNDEKESVHFPVLDLSFCNIRDIHLNLNVKNVTSMDILQLLKTFKINGNGNPFKCNCGLYTVKLLFTALGKEAIKLDWVCVYPEELKGRKVTSLTARDIYCPVNLIDCPTQCGCYVRYDFTSLIIDCRNINLPALPIVLPKEPLELWFKNINLLEFDQRDYLLNVSVLDLSKNKLTHIRPLAASKLHNVSILNLENNHLTSLPVQIRYTNIKRLYLAGNSFKCDCHTKWMKAWLLEKSCPVTDRDILKCTDNKKKVNTFVTTPDSVFVCQKIKTPSIAEHVILPSTIVGSLVFVIVVLSLTIYFQRLTVKVLLYMIFGIRLCYGYNNHNSSQKYDCVVIYDKKNERFADSKIKHHLKELNYHVADIYSDSVVGFTIIKGIKQLIYSSRVAIFCLTANCLNNDLITSLWIITYERSVKNNLGSIILILDKDFRDRCTEENMRLFIKRGRYINMDSILLHKSLQYLMPLKNTLNENPRSNEYESENIEADDMHLTESVPRVIANNTEECLEERKHEILIVYPDVVDEMHHLARYDIIPFLRDKHHSASVLQDDFVFGEDIREGLYSKLHKARHIICMISKETFEDEVKQYILSAIITQAFISNNNYLLLFTYGQIAESEMPENLKTFVNSHITATVRDRNFKERLLEALMYEEQVCDNEETESMSTENCADDENLI